jgi:predicted nucleic acid-binding Zn ribbon protein
MLATVITWDMVKHCLECSEKIIGREDKKFCSDACRNAFNNKRNKDSNNLMRNINNRLRKNYRILSELNPEGKAKATRSKLIGKGFDFDLHTSTLQTKTGTTYHFLYDQGYMLLENDLYILVRQEI